jgi:hypothetical protein
MHRDTLPRLTVPPEQEATHEVHVKYYDEQKTLIEDEIVRRRADQRWDGVRRSFYPNGALWCEDVWRDGLLWEIVYDFLPNGEPVPGPYVKEGNGYRRIYSEDGRLTLEGPSVDGRRHGAWTRHKEDGTRRIIEYNNGYESRSYCDPAAIAAVFQEDITASEKAKKLLSLCDGSTKELRLLVFSGGKVQTAPLVELLALPCPEYSELLPLMRFFPDAGPLLREKIDALLQGDPSDDVCAAVLLGWFESTLNKSIPVEFDGLLKRAIRSAMHPFNRGAISSMKQLLSQLPLDRTEPLVFLSGEPIVEFAVACPTDATLRAVHRKMFTASYTEFSFAQEESVRQLHYKMKENAVDSLLEVDTGPLRIALLVFYIRLLAITSSPKTVPRMLGLLEHKKPEIRQEAKRGLVSLRDLAIPGVAAEIQASSGARQVKVAQVLAALPKSAARKSSATALLPSLQGKAAEVVTRAAK